MNLKRGNPQNKDSRSTLSHLGTFRMLVVQDSCSKRELSYPKKNKSTRSAMEKKNKNSPSTSLEFPSCLGMCIVMATKAEAREDTEKKERYLAL